MQSVSLADTTLAGSAIAQLTAYTEHAPTYRTLLQRDAVTNSNASNWGKYGARGIKFLFTSFEQFFAELGPRPEGMSLDRIENDGNYEVGNVRWATLEEQNSNRRYCKK